MNPETLIAILGVGGLGVLIPKTIDGLRAWQSGRAADEKAANRTALGQLESELTFRRRLQEHISYLRRLLIDMGYPEDRLPALPTREKETTQ